MWERGIPSNLQQCLAEVMWIVCVHKIPHPKAKLQGNPYLEFTGQWHCSDTDLQRAQGIVFNHSEDGKQGSWQDLRTTLRAFFILNTACTLTILLGEHLLLHLHPPGRDKESAALHSASLTYKMHYHIMESNLSVFLIESMHVPVYHALATDQESEVTGEFHL